MVWSRSQSSGQRSLSAPVVRMYNAGLSDRSRMLPVLSMELTPRAAITSRVCSLTYGLMIATSTGFGPRSEVVA